MICFIKLLKCVGHNYNSPVDPTVYARLREMYISLHDWRGCRGGRNFHGELVMLAMVLIKQCAMVLRQ